MRNVIFCTERLQPVCAAPSRRHDHMRRFDALLLKLPFFRQDNTLADIFFHNQVCTAVAKQHLHTLIHQVFFNSAINMLRLFRTQMPDWAVHKLQPGMNRPFPDFTYLRRLAHALNVRVRPEFQIDFIRIMNQLLRKIRADQHRKIAADFIAQRQLSIRKRACAGKAGRNIARIAADAFFRFAFRTAAVFNCLSFFYKQYILCAVIFYQLHGRKNSCRPCTDNNDIVFHKIPPPSSLRKPY